MKNSRFVAIIAIVTLSTFLLGSSANAGRFGLHIGGYGGHYGSSHYYNYGRHSYRPYSRYSGYRYGYRPRYSRRRISHRRRGLYRLRRILRSLRHHRRYY